MTDNSFYIFVDSNLRDFGDNNNFRFYLPSPKIVTKKFTIQIINLSFPSGFLNLTVSNKRLVDSRINFQIYDNGTIIYKMPVSEGFYTPTELCQYMTTTLNNYVFQNGGSTSFEFIYDSTFQKIKVRQINGGSCIIGLKNIYSTNDIIGLDRLNNVNSTYVVEQVYKYFPNVVNCRQLPYNYLVCPQITSNNYIKNLGGNSVLCKIDHSTASKNNFINMSANDTNFFVYECEGQIPSYLDFRILDELGNVQEMNFNLNYTFILKITPIE